MVVYPPVALVVTLRVCAAITELPTGKVEKLIAVELVPMVVVTPAKLVPSETPLMLKEIEGATVAAEAVLEKSLSVLALYLALTLIVYVVLGDSPVISWPVAPPQAV